MLPLTDHPTNANEFCVVYARAVFDVLRANAPRITFNRKKYALLIQRLAIERSLVEIGYFYSAETWIYRQAGYEAYVPAAWVKLPVEVMAEKIAQTGVNMLNERCRKS